MSLIVFDSTYEKLPLATYTEYGQSLRAAYQNLFELCALRDIRISRGVSGGVCWIGECVGLRCVFIILGAILTQLVTLHRWSQVVNQTTLYWCWKYSLTWCFGR